MKKVHATGGGWCQECGGTGSPDIAHVNMDTLGTVVKKNYVTDLVEGQVGYHRARAMREIKDQPPPVHNDSRPIVDLVMEDLEERKRLGIQRYGVPLQANNGRDALVDAYQEALDLACYLRQAIEEAK